MSPILSSLPYDVLQTIFAELSHTDILHFISCSRKFYYPLIDDKSTWRRFCTKYGITDTNTFGGRSFRLVYGRLLHKYGPLIGLWCSDYPFKGTIIEFRLLPDHWQRAGEPAIVGDAWKFSTEPNENPRYPSYIEFMQVGFMPKKKATSKTANDVHVSWHLRSDRDLGFLVYNGMPPPWVRMDGDGQGATPSLHAIAPNNATLKLSDYLSQPLNNPEFPEFASVAWYDADRGMLRIPQEGPPPPINSQHRWYYRGDIRYVDGVPKPAAIAVFPPPDGQPSEVRLPDLHNPVHSLSGPYSAIIPRYYPLRTITQAGQDPASPDWSPNTLVGLWLGDYGPHGTEVLFVEHDTGEAALRAWKITGDVNVPRGVYSWQADLRQEASWTDPSGRQFRAYEGQGRIAQDGFNDTSLIPVRVIMIAKDEILVSWDWELLFMMKFIRYKVERGRTGDK